MHHGSVKSDDHNGAVCASVLPRQLRIILKTYHDLFLVGDDTHRVPARGEQLRVARNDPFAFDGYSRTSFAKDVHLKSQLVVCGIIR